MNVRTIQLQSGAETELLAFLSTEMRVGYRHDSADTIILMGEEYRFRTNSRQTCTIVLKRLSDCTAIDLIGSGGKTGLFGFDWGSEHAFIKRGTELVSDFCKSKGLWCRIV